MTSPLTVVVVTSRLHHYAQALRDELERHRGSNARCFDNNTIFLAAGDPQRGIGSGGATVNALLVAVEHLSAQHGYSVVNPELLASSRFLIVHSGLSQWDPCGSALAALPVVAQSSLPLTALDNLLHLISTYLYPGSPSCGVWVASTDVSVHMPRESTFRVDWDTVVRESPAAVAFAVPMPWSQAHIAGAYRTSAAGNVVEIFSEPSSELLESLRVTTGDEYATSVSAIVFLSKELADRLLRFHVTSPLDACTYLGIDAGIEPMSMSLFLELLLCVTEGMTKERFEAALPKRNTPGQRHELFTEAAWNLLHSTPGVLRAVLLHGATLHSIKAPAPLLSGVAQLTRGEPQNASLRSLQLQPHCDALAPDPSHTVLHSVLDNPLLVHIGAGSFVAHSVLRGRWSIGRNSLLLDLFSPSDCAPSAVLAASSFTVPSSSAIYEPPATPVGFSSAQLVPILEPHVTHSGETNRVHDNIVLWTTTLVDATHTINSTTAINSDNNDNRSHGSFTATGFGSTKTTTTTRILLVASTRDNVHLDHTHPKATVCGQSWASLFARTGITENDLWGDVQQEKTVRSFYHARLFPVEDMDLDTALWLQAASSSASTNPLTGTLSSSSLSSSFSSAFCPFLRRWRRQPRISLATAERLGDVRAHLAMRKRLFAMIGNELCVLTLRHATHTVCMLPYFEWCARERNHSVLTALDRAAVPSVDGGGGDTGVTARSFAAIAEMLGAFAAGRGGLRSGPAGHQRWRAPFSMLEQGEISRGIEMLALERARWLATPELLVRAARHYERASQIIIRQAVMSAHQFVKTVPRATALLADGEWAVARASARMDLAGGWTDTPPITYEHGGAVVNVAFRVDGAYPIMARARCIVEPHLVLVLLGEHAQEVSRIHCDTLDDLASYDQPSIPGALLKAAFVCTKIVSLASNAPPLNEQLASHGYELHTMSSLPQGSGLGTSSILAGAILAALWRATGTGYSDSDVVHAVLHLEQLLTTGGGWQDQVGGIQGGVKVARSPAALPLHVVSEPLPLSAEQLDTLSRHMVLVYTGKTRLARNLLQGVIRNWYARIPELVSIFDGLVENAEKSVKAFQDFDLESVGRCLTKYWEQKKEIAPGSEPEHCRQIFELVSPMAYGYSLAGAGGGGFLTIVTRERDARASVEALLRAQLSDDVFAGLVFHDVQVDPLGMHVTVERVDV